MKRNFKIKVLVRLAHCALFFLLCACAAALPTPAEAAGCVSRRFAVSPFAIHCLLSVDARSSVLIQPPRAFASFRCDVEL